MPERLPAPGPSFLREQELRGGDRGPPGGRRRPSMPAGEGRGGLLGAAAGGGPAWCVGLAPAAGPPPDPPLARLGPARAGGLSGMILEDAGRLQIRLGLVAPPDDPDRPWRCPAIVRAAFRWEPARAAALRPNALAAEVLTAFRRAIEGLGRS